MRKFISLYFLADLRCGIYLYFVFGLNKVNVGIYYVQKKVKTHYILTL